MTLPGTEVNIRDEALSRFAAQDTAAWFVAGFTDKGPAAEPTTIRNLGEFVDRYGERVANSYLYDSLDVFFREGGGIAYVSRVVGPGAASADLELYDAAGVTPTDVSLTVSAIGPGADGNDLQVEVAAAGTGYELIVTDADDNELERSGELGSRDAAVGWGSSSDYVRVTLGPSAENPKVAAAAALAGGTGDETSATDTEWAAALELFAIEYGPGQVSAPGRTSAEMHQALAEHAMTHNRMALLDLDDTATAADLIADADDLRDVVVPGSAAGLGRAAAAFAPWAVVPGVSLGTTRLVPYSAVQAALIGRSEALGNSPNVPAAGANGEARYAIGLSQEPWGDADREALNDNGVNAARLIRGAVRTYGYRTLVDAGAYPQWKELGGARIAMAVAGEAELVAEDYVFTQIDSSRVRIGEFGGRLAAICLGYYNDGSLYGETAADAFFVDVGPTVNTEQTIAEGKLLARIELATAPFAERVEITIIKAVASVTPG